MTTKWTHRIQAVVPIADAETMRAIAAKIDPDPASTGGFSVRLSASGKEPATHVACDMPATDEMVVAFEAVVADYGKKGLSAEPVAFRAGAKTAKLTAAPKATAAKAGDDWSFGKMLKDQKLVVIVPKEK